MPAVLPTTAKDPATVFVVDDDPAIRKSLRWLIESIGLPVKTYASGSDFLDEYDPKHPGCLVLDVRMPGMSGLDLQERLCERGRCVPIIVLTAFGDVPMAVRAMKFGAIHFFEKPVKDQELLDHIQAALLEDQKWRERDSQDQFIRDRHQLLTKRECEVLGHVVDGCSSKEIGGKLGVSFKTVEAHRAKIMKKMAAESVPHLIRMVLAISNPDQSVDAEASEDIVPSPGEG